MFSQQFLQFRWTPFPALTDFVRGSQDHPRNEMIISRGQRHPGCCSLSQVAVEGNRAFWIGRAVDVWVSQERRAFFSSAERVLLLGFPFGVGAGVLAAAVMAAARVRRLAGKVRSKKEQEEEWFQGDGRARVESKRLPHVHGTLGAAER